MRCGSPVRTDAWHRVAHSRYIYRIYLLQMKTRTKRTPCNNQAVLCTARHPDQAPHVYIDPPVIWFGFDGNVKLARARVQNLQAARVPIHNYPPSLSLWSQGGVGRVPRAALYCSFNVCIALGTGYVYCMCVGVIDTRHLLCVVKRGGLSRWRINRVG